MFAVQSLAIPSEKIREDRFNSWMGIQTGFKIGIHYTTAHFSCYEPDSALQPEVCIFKFSNHKEKRYQLYSIKKG